MQSVTEGVARRIAAKLNTSTYSVAVDVGGADGALVNSLTPAQHRRSVGRACADRSGGIPVACERRPASEFRKRPTKGLPSVSKTFAVSGSNGRPIREK